MSKKNEIDATVNDDGPLSADAKLAGEQMRGTPADADFRASSALRATLLILVLSVAWTVILPGYVAYRNHSFFDIDIRKRVAVIDSRASGRYAEYEEEKKRLDDWIKRVGDQVTQVLAKPDAYEKVKSLVETRSVLAAARASIKPPLSVSGFASSDVTVVFLLHYLALGSLLMLAPRRRPNPRLVAFTALCLAVLLQFPNYLRNFFLNRYIGDNAPQGRLVYSWANYDIDKASFWLQEMRVYVMFILLAVLWSAWTWSFEEIKAATTVWLSAEPDVREVGRRATVVSEVFSHWQAQSMLLTLAFLPWTYFFWSTVTRQHDTRYILPAIVIHVIWGVSWLLLSASFYLIWNRWASFRQMALAQLIGTELAIPGSDLTLEVFREAAPFSPLQVMGATVVAFVSFTLPLLQVFIK